MPVLDLLRAVLCWCYDVGVMICVAQIVPHGLNFYIFH